MDIYEFDDYRDFIRKIIEIRKALNSFHTFQNLAKAIRVQSPYLSKILNRKANMSRDQLFLAIKFLDLSSKEAIYLELLHDYHTCSLKERSEVLKKKINATKQEQLETKHHLKNISSLNTNEDYDEYYLNPINQIVHISLSLEKFRKNPMGLSAALIQPKYVILNSLKTLEKLKIIKISEKEITILINNLHLPRESKLYPSWSTRLKILGLNRSQMLNSEKNYGFSVIFSSDNKTRTLIQKKFLKFINESEKLVKNSDCKEVYQLNFDLFNWT